MFGIAYLIKATGSWETVLRGQDTGQTNYLDSVDLLPGVPQDLPSKLLLTDFQLLCQNVIAFCNNPTSFPPLFPDNHTFF